jgi:hypothetical protein
MIPPAPRAGDRSQAAGRCDSAHPLPRRHTFSPFGGTATFQNVALNAIPVICGY